MAFGCLLFFKIHGRICGEILLDLEPNYLKKGIKLVLISRSGFPGS